MQKRGCLVQTFMLPVVLFSQAKDFAIVLNIRNAEASILPRDKSVNTLNFSLSHKIKIALIY